MLNTSDPPQTWLWQEIIARFGVEAATNLYQDWLVYARIYSRKRDGSSLPDNAPKQRPGKPSLHPVYEQLSRE
jgi:hypothetical protein